MNGRRAKAKKMAGVAMSALAVVGATMVAYDVSKPVPLVSRTLRATAREQSRADGWVMTTNLYQILPAKFTPAGTIQAMIERLSYLKELGVKTVSLMAILRSGNAQSCDTIDYGSVEPRLGTNQDLQDFVRAAHAAKIRVLIELAVNHTSSQNPWFVGNDTERHDDWYVWDETDRGWDSPWGSDEPAFAKTWLKDPRAELDRNHNGNAHDDDFFYCAFCETKDGAAIADPPDLNWRAALQQLENAQGSSLFDEVEAIMRHWVITVGVDGFVASSASYLVENGKPSRNRDQPETHRVWQELRRRLTRLAPAAVLLAEAPTETYEQLRGYYGSLTHEEFQGVFHFKYPSVIMDSIKNGWRHSHLFPDLYEIQSYLPYDTAQRRLLGQDLLFLSNHERSTGDRVATQLGGNQSQIKLAASVYVLLSGNPVIYYGEEYGMSNTPGASGDDAVRGNMDWAEVGRQRTSSSSVYQHYARLLRLRERYDALRGGRMLVVPSKSDNDAAFDGAWTESGRVSLMREYFEERILVVSNLFDVAQNVTIDLGSKGLPIVPDGTPVAVLMGSDSNEPVGVGNLRNYPVGNIPANGTRVLYLGVLPAKYRPITLYESPLGSTPTN